MRKTIDYILEDYILTCKGKGLSYKTIKNYHNHLLAFIKYSELTDIENLSGLLVKKYLQHKRESGASPNYVKGIYKVIKCFLEFMYNEEYIENNIIKKIPEPKGSKKVIQIFNDKEVQKILNGEKNGKAFLKFRNYFIFMLLIDTGIRVTELTLIKDGDISLNRIVINGKGNKQRIVAMSSKCYKVYKDYLKKKMLYTTLINSEVEEYIFISRTGRKLTPEIIELYFRDMKKKYHIRKEVRCSPHTCRRYYAVKTLEVNDNIYYLSKLLGHSNTKITEIYLSSVTTEKILDINGKYKSPLDVL